MGLARARLGLGMAPSGVSASWGKWFGGRNLSPRKGGSRMYVVNGMAREATQGLGGRKSPAVMQNAYVKARSEDVAPEMHASLAKACAGLEVELLVKDLDRGVFSEASDVLGSEKEAETRARLRRFRSVRICWRQ